MQANGWGNFFVNENGLNDLNGQQYRREYKTNLKKWYIQPSMNFMPLKVFKVGVAAKLSSVNYDQVGLIFSNAEPGNRGLDNNNFTNHTQLFIELSVNLQIAFPPPWLKLDLGLTICKNYDERAYDRKGLNHRVFNASIGLTFDLFKINTDKK